MINVPVPAPDELAALIRTLVVSTTDGVPVIAPVFVLTESPAGSGAAANVVGLFDPVIS